MQTETEIKKEAIKELKKLKIFNFAIPAGRFSMKGLPDRVMHLNERVVYLEFKSLKGKQSMEQKNFQYHCLNDGIDYLIIRSWEELKNYIYAV